MIIKEYYGTRDDGVRLFRSYSDQGVLIRKLGTYKTYSEAIDVDGSRYRYVETEQKIDTDKED